MNKVIIGKLFFHFSLFVICIILESGFNKTLWCVTPLG